MTPAVAGWIVLGVLSAASLVLMLFGVFRVMSAQREMKFKLARLGETQRRIVDPRVETAVARLARDAASAKELLERAQRAIATIGTAARYLAIALRIVKLLT